MSALVRVSREMTVAESLTLSAMVKTKWPALPRDERCKHLDDSMVADLQTSAKELALERVESIGLPTVFSAQDVLINYLSRRVGISPEHSLWTQIFEDMQFLLAIQKLCGKLATIDHLMLEQLFSLSTIVTVPLKAHTVLYRRPGKNLNGIPTEEAIRRRVKGSRKYELALFDQQVKREMGKCAGGKGAGYRGCFYIALLDVDNEPHEIKWLYDLRCKQLRNSRNSMDSRLRHYNAA